MRLAREASSGELAFVAGSMGPLGALVKPYGTLQLSQVREIFAEQARVLLEAGRRPDPARDVRQPARGGRGGPRRARPVRRDPDRRRDDVPLGRPHRVRRGRVALARDARAGRRGRGRNELHARTAGDARHLLAARGRDLGAALRHAQRRIPERRERPQRLPLLARLPARVRGRVRRGGSGDRRRLLRHDPGAHPRDGARRLGKAPRVGGERRLRRRRGRGRAPGGAGDRDVAAEAQARGAGRVRRDRRGRAAEGRRRLHGRRGRAAPQGRRRRRGQRHRQSDGAAADVVDRGRGADPARGRPRRGRADHDSRPQRARAPVGPARSRRPRREGDPLPRRRPAQDRRLSAGEAGLGGRRARTAPHGEEPQRRRGPRGQRDRLADARSRSRARPIPRRRTRRSSSPRSARRSTPARRSPRPSRSTTSRRSRASSSGRRRGRSRSSSA